MQVETKQDQLLRAGAEYEAILASLRKHQQDYSRLLLDIGLRERGANAGEVRVISLPEMPSLPEQEERIAGRLLSLAAELAYRPGRITPAVVRGDLAALAPLRCRTSPFSPEHLSQELADEVLGERGTARARHQVAQFLKRHLEQSLDDGAAFAVSGVSAARNANGRLIDTMSALRLANWLTNFAMALEEQQLSGLLTGVDALIDEIDRAGRATVVAQHTLEAGGHAVRLSLRKNLLRVSLSSSLQKIVQGFIDSHIAPPEPASGSAWFRYADV